MFRNHWLECNEKQVYSYKMGDVNSMKSMLPSYGSHQTSLQFKSQCLGVFQNHLLQRAIHVVPRIPLSPISSWFMWFTWSPLSCVSYLWFVKKLEWAQGWWDRMVKDGCLKERLHAHTPYSVKVKHVIFHRSSSAISACPLLWQEASYGLMTVLKQKQLKGLLYYLEVKIIRRRKRHRHLCLPVTYGIYPGYCQTSILNTGEEMTK